MNSFRATVPTRKALLAATNRKAGMAQQDHVKAHWTRLDPLPNLDSHPSFGSKTQQLLNKGKALHVRLL